MREIFAMLLLFGLLWLCLETEIPAKSVTAVEAWLDAQAKGAAA